MKKLLLALTIVALVASTASALEVLGGKIGLGGDQLNLTDVQAGGNAFLSYDPTWMPALQLRVGMAGASGHMDASDISSSQGFGVAGLYRILRGDVSPYVGVKLTTERTDSTVVGGLNGTHMITTTDTLAIVAGGEWALLKQLSLFVETNVLSFSTAYENTDDTPDDVAKRIGTTTLFGNSVIVGAVLYL